jgi:hypothetical protein
VACVVLNATCVLLTYERTFWAVTILGCLFVTARARRLQRMRALLLAPVAILLVFIPLATLSPHTLTTARERLLSVGQYGSDRSVSYRITEYGHVFDEIQLRPVVGSGLGATVYWGRPDDHVPPKTFTFAHNGYLWIAWKLGLPAALLLFGAVAAAIVRRGPPQGSRLYAALFTGAQGALLALMVASVTFPAFSAFPITTVMGVLLAVAAAPRAAHAPAQARLRTRRRPAGSVARVSSAA